MSPWYFKGLYLLSFNGISEIHGLGYDYNVATTFYACLGTTRCGGEKYMLECLEITQNKTSCTSSTVQSLVGYLNKRFCGEERYS